MMKVGKTLQGIPDGDDSVIGRGSDLHTSRVANPNADPDPASRLEVDADLHRPGIEKGDDVERQPGKEDHNIYPV